ncbi:MAG: signal recognition particle receptor subunit alpha [Candidatus Pacearchaeota archaeon]|nr:signal recognition particle receptor subunit alpha [Candidatus Pacearchaeota archaeon]
MLDKLSSILKKTTDKIANAIFLDKNLVDSIIKDLQRALLEADVNVSLVLELTKKIKQTALDERIKGLEKKEHIIKLLHDELIRLLGTSKEIQLGKHNVFLMVGLYGSGKTTTIAKLASYYAKRGVKVCAIGLDIHRPAASEQLKQLCDKLNIKSFISPEEKSPKKIWEKFKNEIKNYSLIIVDTAGRHSLDKDLIQEIKEIANFAKPTETFLVMPADIGQAAKSQAQAFKKALSISGIIITRMDSTAKAGGALTACAEVNAPVVFIGTGEKPSDLETFNPESFLSRLLGMGDLKTLMEKIHSAMSKEDLEKTQAKLREGKFTMREFESQLETMSSMGTMDKLISLIPGFGSAKIPEEAMEKQQEKIKRWKAAIKSFTQEELDNPELLEKQTSRIQRIAKGSGTSTSDVRMLVKQYKLIKDMIKSSSSLEEAKLDQKTMLKLARKFSKKIKF